ncbi:hypothetical protein SAMN05444920_11456 [Nonomuraea solani]|uniref:Uncharacterized protein n=1 Tax=Nonomuraea solani TaxID=1144553 RepID=A0A1H6EPI2_9ACTN|nr:hypothetical protein [Nonomuraea solani]SEG99780.1 hypothetical protein SAMN05444920_11456 [Nonomuraea solani]
MTEETPIQEPAGTATDNVPASEDEINQPGPPLTARIEQEQKERRLRSEIIDVGQNWYGGSNYRVDQGGTLNGAGRDIIQYFGGDEPSVSTHPIPSDEFERIRTCLIETASQQELLDRLANMPVVLLRGDPHSGRWTAALQALMQQRLTCNHLIVKDPKKVRPNDLRAGHGYVLRVDEETWPRRPEAVLDQLCAVARESGAVIVAVVPNDCAVTKSVVTHKCPAPGDVIRRRLVHLSPGIEDELEAVRLSLDEHVAGCRPWEAVETARQLADGRRQGRSLAAMVADLPYVALAELSKSLEKTDPVLSRHFLISSAVLYGLPEAVVSEAALTLAQRIRQDEQRDAADKEDQGFPIWERLSQWISHPGLDAAEATRGGEGQRIEVKPGMANRLLVAVWEQLPAVRPALYDWLAELVRDDDWRVRLKAAYAVGKLATCDFHVINKRFLTPWSNEDGHAKVLAWALESATLADPNVAVLVRGRLKEWTTGTYRQRLAAALGYGSVIGVRHIDEALDALHTLAAAAVYLDTCDHVARSVAEVYTSETAVAVLREQARWAAGEHVGEQVTAALAFVRLATAERDEESYPPLWRHEVVDELALLWVNALNWGLSTTRGDVQLPAYTPSAWLLMADWAKGAATEPTINNVINEVLRRATRRLRPSWTFHLHLWHKQQSITAAQFAEYIRLVKGG